MSLLVFYLLKIATLLAHLNDIVLRLAREMVNNILVVENIIVSVLLDKAAQLLSFSNGEILLSY